mgnify:FL=1
MGIASVKIEGRQLIPAYVEQVTKTWRSAIDRLLQRRENFQVEGAWMNTLANLAMRKLKMPFVVGPAINCYNLAILKVLIKQGMTRWVMPVELSGDWLKKLLKQAGDENIRSQFECEVFACGYMPLAYSARCFSARSEEKAKDDCQYSCIKYPLGRKMNSREGERVFVLNGVQTMSSYQYN